jgi:hypothetical protein
VFVPVAVISATLLIQLSTSGDVGAPGIAVTIIFLLAMLVHPLTSVYEYVIVRVPAPAREGLKLVPEILPGASGQE